jgi:hypothetical protein
VASRDPVTASFMIPIDRKNIRRPGNKNARANKRGPAHLPHFVMDAIEVFAIKNYFVILVRLKSVLARMSRSRSAPGKFDERIGLPDIVMNNAILASH